jgi:hypothetical protein
MIIDLDKPKTVSHYLSILKSCETASLKRFQTFFNLIAEAIDITAGEFLSDGIFIPWTKFDGIGLSFSDAQSMQYMFSEDINWLVLPSQPIQKKGGIIGLSINLPERDNGPFFVNCSNFKKALADAILFRTLKTFPFETTPQVIRITNQLIEDAENFFPAIETDEGLVLWVKNYQADNEDPTPKAVINLINFYKYLDFIGAILVIDDDPLDKDHPLGMAEWNHVDESSPLKRLLYTKEEKIKILKPDVLKKFAVSLRKNNPAADQEIMDQGISARTKRPIDRSGNNTTKDDKLEAIRIVGNSIVRLITKHLDDGDYFYKDKRINVNRGTLYYDVFDILSSHSDQDGFLSYEHIENYLVERKHPHIEDEGKRNKRIQNAVLNEQQGFFRHAKIGGNAIKNKIPDGRPLVEAARGDGLQLNNPILK